VERFALKEPYTRNMPPLVRPELASGVSFGSFSTEFWKQVARGRSLPVFILSKLHAHPGNNLCQRNPVSTHASADLRNLFMEIKKNGSQPSAKGPTDWFTGTVRIDPLFQPNEARRAGAATVTFEPGARTAWHTHPLGQTLIVTTGCGRVQREGGPVEEIRPGDVVWFPPGEKHWHGAAPTTAMTHIAVQEQLDGKVVDWMEHVSDDQYPKA
jgi:quercetin dioxygenase-like cupin family protein